MRKATEEQPISISLIRDIMVPFVKENSVVLWIVFCFVMINVAFLSWKGNGELIIYFSEHRSYAVDLFFRFVTHLAEGSSYIAAFLIFGFLVSFRQAFMIFIAGIMSLLFSAGLKLYFSHPRPHFWITEVLGKDDFNYVSNIHVLKSLTSSFPSGHTTGGFALFCLLAFMIRTQYLKLLFVCLAILVGVSRVYLSQHFLKDITAGALLGTFIAIVVHFYYKNSQQLKTFAKP